MDRRSSNTPERRDAMSEQGKPPTHEIELFDQQLNFNDIGVALGVIHGSDITGCYYEGKSIIAKKITGGKVLLYLDKQSRAEDILVQGATIGYVHELVL